MRIRVKTRALVTYLGLVCCSTVLFGVYFFLSPSASSSKRRGIERAARDSWSNTGAQQPPGLLFRLKNQQNIAFLWRGAERVDRRADERKPEPPIQQEQKPVLQAPTTPLSLPPVEKLQHLSWEELSNVYHRYTQQIQVACAAKTRLGKVTDGGWEVCEDAPYRPAQPCLVYSFGVGNDFSFDDSVVKRYGCEVHSFDPSMKVGDHQRPSGVHFHAIGLADITFNTTDGWRMLSLSDIRHKLGHEQGPVSILKVDIEEWEWRVLPALLKEQRLSSVTQLLVELHQCDGCSVYNPEQQDKEPPRERYVTALSVLKGLHDLGFRIFWQHQNPACRYLSKFHWQERSGCCELHMVRTP